MHLKETLILVSVVAFIVSFPLLSNASVFGDIKGVVHDPQYRPVAQAEVTVRSRSSDFSQRTETNGSGEFLFQAIPLGEYLVRVSSRGFTPMEQAVTVITDGAPAVHFQLTIAPLSQQVDVVASPAQLGSDSPTPATLISRKDVSETPGADRTGSLAFITDFVPGSYLAHNQLHIRGGHQVSWLIDGVPVPNTNIADTVGPQFDPKDVDYLEVQRGSYSAEFGDRTYGVFNVVPRNGFERSDEGELLLSYGDFNQTNDEVSFGSHSSRFAYYASLNGTRSDYGLETPTAAVLHDQADGLGGFTSLIYNAGPKDQLRLVAQFRKDFYQVPNTPEAELAGERDAEREADSFVNFSWVHTFSSSLLLTVSPFYHFNLADFVGSGDAGFASIRDRRSSNYAGAQAAIQFLSRRHSVKGGFYGFHQSDSALFSLSGIQVGPPTNVKQIENPEGHLAALFLEDQYKPYDWLTFTGGVRYTSFRGTIGESATSPRAGVAVRVPHVRWVLHGFYGRFYQAPPLVTVAGPLLQFALSQGFDFIPLYGERDEERQFGLTVPLRGWVIDSDYFSTNARNFFDHNALGDSNIFFPLTIERARIRALEVTVRSPLLFRRGNIHVAYSHQRAQGQGAITGGLTDFSSSPGFFFLDHDQRNTLSAGCTMNLPRQSFASTTVRYGSGFTDGDGPAHLPGHTLVDLSAGKSLGENWQIALQAVNIANKKFLLDNSETFGGTHYVEPRQVYAEIRYRFHY